MRMIRVRWALLIEGLLLGAACAPRDRAADLRVRTEAVVNGTRAPQVVPLLPDQILSIGWLYPTGDPASAHCTATLVAPDVVVTAAHCVTGQIAADLGFGIGEDPGDPVATFTSAVIHEHPTFDAAFIVLGESSAGLPNGPRPIPPSRLPIPSSAIGKAVDAAGYGDTQDDSREGRYFARVYLSDILDASTILVDGRGQQGLCFGDSGGPLLDVDASGAPVVLAVESFGDGTCLDEDTMVRVDAIVTWFDPSMPGQGPIDPCNGLDYLGRCSGNVSEYCEDGSFERVDCERRGQICAYVDDAIGYFCVDAPPLDAGVAGDAVSVTADSGTRGRDANAQQNAPDAGISATGDADVELREEAPPADEGCACVSPRTRRSGLVGPPLGVIVAFVIPVAVERMRRLVRPSRPGARAFSEDQALR